MTERALQHGVAATASRSDDRRVPRELGPVLAACQSARRSVFLFGSDSGTIYRLRDAVSAAFPGLVLSGICDADFDGPASAELVAHIARTRPGMIVVDMPRRDFLRFERDHAARFAGAPLVHLPGAFRRHLRGADGGTAFPGFRLPFAVGAGFLRIVLGQALRSGPGRGRQPSSPVLRREG